MPIDLHDIVDLICLLYHEARNVRHPIGLHRLGNDSKYGRLVNLPRNRNDAWRQLTKLRICAVSSGTLEGAKKTFERHFGVSLQDLVELYAMQIWRDSAYGGNKWNGISLKVCKLIDAISSSGWQQAEGLYDEIMSMRHNTGLVADKLRSLSVSLPRGQ